MFDLKSDLGQIEMTGVLLGTGISLGLLFVLTIALGLVVNFTTIDSDLTAKTMFVISYLSIFIGGIIAAYSSQSSGWLNGSLVGLVMILGIVFLGSFSLPIIFSWGLAMRVIISILIAALGGMIGVNII